MKNIELESKVEVYRQIEDKFCQINLRVIDIVKKWRDGKRQINSKINANGKKDVVTDADIAIHDFASKIFEGQIPVFSEESFKYDFSITHEPLYIVIDPIDGTKEFAKNGSDWSISMCAVENGKPVISSLFMPDRNELFTTIKGQGVNLNGLPLHTPEIVTNRLAVSPRQIAVPEYQRLIIRSGLSPAEVPALTPKICALLRGDVDCAVYFPQSGQSASLWDYAASVLLIQEIGGKMSSLCGNELPFRGDEIIHKRGWLATRSQNNLHELLACLGNSGQL